MGSPTNASKDDIHIEVDSGNQSLYIYNVKQTGNLEIKKTDKDSGKPMQGVQFKIKDSNGNYIILTKDEDTEIKKVTNPVRAVGLKTTTDANSATIFQTNSDGKIMIYNLLVGKYTLEEINTGNLTGYDVKDGKYIFKDGKAIGNEPITVNVVRQRSYVTKANKTTTSYEEQILPVGVYEIGTVANTKNEDISNNAITTQKNEDGKYLKGIQLKSETKNNQKNQKFYLGYNNALQAYKLTNLEANLVLSLKRDSAGNPITSDERNPVVTWENRYRQNSYEQYWTIEKVGDYYLLRSKANPKLYLYITQNNYTNVNPSDSKPTSNFYKFKFNPVISTNTVEIANKRKYIKVSGTVWEDARIHGTKVTQTGDNKFDEEKDILLQGIKVELMEAGKDSPIAVSTTNEEGNYIFDNIEIDNLGKYYIRYWYDGEIYTTVNPYSGNPKDAPRDSSKAKEGEERNTLNNKYQNITSTNDRDQSTVNGNNNESFNIKYTLNEGGQEDATAITKYRESFANSLDEEENVRNVEGFPENDEYGYIRQNKIYASTSETGYWVLGGENQQSSSSFRDGTISYGSETINSIRQNGIEELASRNCGLTERSKIDLSVTSEVENVKVTVNGYTNIYNNESSFNFKENDENDESVEKIDKFRADVKTGFYGITRTLYKSDVAWYTDNPDLCEVYVKYKMTVHNNSLSLAAKVTDLLGYYDSQNYKVNEVYYVNEKGEKIFQDNIDSTEVPKNSEVTQYSLLHYDVLKDTQIPAMHSKSIYVTFKVNPETVTGVINNDKVLENAIITEINTYTTYDQENVYASIDKDSAPGNCEPGNKSTYEDDTAISPSITLNLTTEERTISGTVFEDEQTEFSKSRNERLGDGEYNEGEGLVEGVKVELLKYNDDETDLNPATLYLYEEIEQQNGGRTISGMNTKVYKRITDTNITTASRYTDETGKYEFTGIIPDRYILRFTYADGNVIYKAGNNGEKTIRANDYKATIITSDLIKNALNNNGIVGNNSTKGKLLWGRPSDKWYLYHENKRYSDAMDEKSEISRQTTLSDDSIINNATYGQNENISKLAYTGTINVQLEVDTNSHDEKNTNSGFRIIEAEDSDDNSVYYQENHIKHETKDIDFGIIQKAKQQYEIKKEVTNVKVILSNGQVLIDGNPNTQNLQYTQYLPNLNLRSDNVKLEIDNELIHGATLEITYQVTATNNAENNYATENYYKYGEKYSSDKPIGTLKISKIIDYIDDDLTAVITDENQNVLSGKLVVPTENGKEPEIVFDDGRDPLNAKQYLADDVINSAKNYKQLLMLINDADIETGQSKVWEYKANKLLSLNNNDDLEFTNKVEGIEYRGTTLPPTNIIPGNFDPDPDSQTTIVPEVDNYKSYLTITSPTGGNKNYVIYITIASACMVLAIGIYIIKKKVI